MTFYRNMTRRMHAVFVLLLLGFAYVAWHLYGVQIERHPELFAKAKAKYTTRTNSQGARGEIFDCDGNLLVGNIPTFEVFADPSLVKTQAEAERIARFLADKSDKADYDTILRRLNDKHIVATAPDGTQSKRVRKYAVLMKDVDFEEGLRLRNEVRAMKLPGISFRETSRRNYPKDTLLANILGMTSISDGRVRGIRGIERYMGEAMKGSAGSAVYERARDGRRVSYARFSADPALDGANIYLTIREPIQAIVEEELDKLCAEAKPLAAWAVMVDPQTGDVIAAAQRPTYNPNERENLCSDAFRCRFSEDVYEPGSIMKPFVVAYALDNGYVAPDTLIDCERKPWLYERRLLHDSHPVGIAPVSEVIKQSSNIGTAKIALMLGNRALDKALRSFGFGSRTGIQLRPETAGIFRRVERWDNLSVTRFCIGQGIGVSSLQMVRAYCMLANGGWPVNLRLVDRIERDGVETPVPYVRGACVFQNEKTAHDLTEMLIGVTEPGGTSKSAAIPGYYVAGKTGTAQKVINGVYTNRHIASFVGYVPARNPRFVLLISCDEPQGKSYFGGAVCGPVFSAIASRTLRYLRVEPDVDVETWLAERKEIQRKVAERKKREREQELAARAARPAGGSRFAAPTAVRSSVAPRSASAVRGSVPMRPAAPAARRGTQPPSYLERRDAEIRPARRRSAAPEESAALRRRSDRVAN